MCLGVNAGAAYHRLAAGARDKRFRKRLRRGHITQAHSGRLVIVASWNSEGQAAAQRSYRGNRTRAANDSERPLSSCIRHGAPVERTARQRSLNQWRDLVRAGNEVSRAGVSGDLRASGAAWYGHTGWSLAQVHSSTREPAGHVSTTCELRATAVSRSTVLTAPTQRVTRQAKRGRREGVPFRSQ